MKTRFPNLLRNLSTLVLSTLVIFLSSCSSSSDIPLTTNYYLLNTLYYGEKSLNINKRVLVEVLELPDYLDQPQLVMQFNKHQLHYSRFDMWAEPLQVGFTKALINDLNLNKKSIQFVTDERKFNDNIVYKLMVRIDYFHPNSASKVILSGVFWVDNNNDERYKVQQPFSFELLLNDDGYTHAIEKMRQLVTMMSVSVLQDNYK
jgi:uncharacterized lipoprotein YmbA